MFCSTCALVDSVFLFRCNRIECVNYSPDVAP